MADLPLKIRLRNALNEAGPKVLETPTTPRHETPDTEVNDMPFEHDIGDSTPKNKREQSRNGGAA